MKLLLHLYNECWMGKGLPRRWKMALIKTLLKYGKDLKLTTSYSQYPSLMPRQDPWKDNRWQTHLCPRIKSPTQFKPGRLSSKPQHDRSSPQTRAECHRSFPPRQRRVINYSHLLWLWKGLWQGLEGRTTMENDPAQHSTKIHTLCPKLPEYETR